MGVVTRVGHKPVPWWFLLLAAPASLMLGACGSPSAPAVKPASRDNPTTVAFQCTNPQPVPTVQGNPHITTVPSLESVSLVPSSGGLTVSFRFRKPLVYAPEGVYIAWTVYLYRHRVDASSFNRSVELEFQDRGIGFEPTGWTIVASTYTSQTPLGGNVQINEAHNQLTTFFPAGFVDLNPPFFWFASQEEFRAYLPQPNTAAPQDWSVNGAIFTDCPAGVRHDPNSAPYVTKLLTATG